jgi:signal recognition particle subunit SRP54
MLERISDKFSDILRQLSGRAQLSQKNIEDAINEIKIALLEADVNLRVVRRFINRTAEEALGEKVLRAVSPGQQFTKILYDRMVTLLGDEKNDLLLKGPDTQTVILLIGLQGSGKTTTAAKLAVNLKKSGRRPMLVAADLKRPAAIEQLAILAGKAGVDAYTDSSQKNPVAVVKNGLRKAAREGMDTVIVDTSGRLQIDEELMSELQDVRKASKADEVILVADAMTGQNVVDVAKSFDEQIGLTGIILSKFDSDTRGGAALSVKSVTGKAIKYVGTGEGLDSLEPFFPDRMASRILGMGDVVTLVEKSQETIEVEEAEKLREKMESKTFTLEDFLDQFRRVRKMGSIESLMEMIPGMKGNVSPESIDEAEMRKQEAIILSMTLQERGNHRIIGPSRRKRIARGSGSSVFDVNRLIKQFEKTRLMMKKVTKNKKYQMDLLSQLGAQ